VKALKLELKLVDNVSCIHTLGCLCREPKKYRIVTLDVCQFSNWDIPILNGDNPSVLCIFIETLCRKLKYCIRVTMGDI